MGLDPAGDRAGPHHYFHIYERCDYLAIPVIEGYDALLFYFGPTVYFYWVAWGYLWEYGVDTFAGLVSAVLSDWGRYIFYFGQTDCEFELVQSRHFRFDGCWG